MTDQPPAPRSRLLVTVAAAGIGLLLFTFVIALAVFSRESADENAMFAMTPYTEDATVIAWRMDRIPDKPIVDGMLSKLPLQALGLPHEKVGRCVVYQGKLGSIAVIDGDYDRAKMSKSLEAMQTETSDQGGLKVYSLVSGAAVTLSWGSMIQQRLVFGSSPEAVKAVQQAAGSDTSVGRQPDLRELLRRLNGDDIVLVAADGTAYTGVKTPTAVSMRIVSPRWSEGSVVFQAKDESAAKDLVDTVQRHATFPWTPKDLKVRQDGRYVIGTFRTEQIISGR
jgi:hypothetical protein